MNSATNTALIVGDVQQGIIANFGFARDVLPRLQVLIPAAREKDVDIVYLRAGLRMNGADTNSRNSLFKSFFQSGDLFDADSENTAIEPSIEPHYQDTVILKRRTSGFASTDLELVLRAKGIENLVLCGVATSAMITATAFAAADLDFRVTILRDGCADADPALHKVLMDTLFPARDIAVTTTSDWIGHL